MIFFSVVIFRNYLSNEKMTFPFGKFFANKSKWQQIIDDVRSQGGYVPSFIAQAIPNGAVDPFHQDFTNLKRKNIRFRGRTYSDFDRLAEAEIKNSPTIYEFKSEVETELARLDSRGGIRFISEREARSPGSIINPIQWERSPKADGTWKKRFIIHSKANCFYSRPRFSLTDISEEIHVLAKFTELVVCDNSDCFYQIKVTEAASRWLRFKVDFPGEPVRFAEMLVLGMGVSGSPYIVQSANKLLVEAYSFKYGVYCEVYIDDTWSSTKAGVPHFDHFCAPLGIHFKSSKKVQGSNLTILGVTIDLQAKTAKLDDRKANVLALEAARLSVAARAGKIAPNQLSTFLGRAEFCSKVTTLGRVNTSELVRCFAEFASDGGDVSSDQEILELSELAGQELEWWKGIMGWGRSLCPPDHHNQVRFKSWRRLYPPPLPASVTHPYL